MTTFIDQTKLQDRYGAGGLARLASPVATLNAEATTRITQACADANGLVDARVSGLGFDLSGPPAQLISIAARLAARRLWVLTWASRTTAGIPKSLEDEAKQAEEELTAITTGVSSGDGSSPSQTVAGGFSWSDIGNEPADTNPRTTVRHRMRRLP